MSEARSTPPADILLVEDNPGDIRLTQEAFDASHVANRLHVVNDGSDALDFLNARAGYEAVPRPDLVLLDLNLPRKNGEEFLEALADTAPRIQRIPVIVLTSSEAEADICRAYDLRANAYMTKPVDPAAFIEAIRAFETFWLQVAWLPPAGDRDE